MKQAADGEKIMMKLPLPGISATSTSSSSSTAATLTNGYTPSLMMGKTSSLSLDTASSKLFQIDSPSSPLLYHSMLDKLGYSVQAWSSYSAQYHPRMTIVNVEYVIILIYREHSCQ